MMNHVVVQRTRLAFGIILLGSLAASRLPAQEPILTFLAHRYDRVCRLQFSPDGKIIASAGQTGIVNVWDAATGKEIRSFAGHLGNVYSLAFLVHDTPFYVPVWQGILNNDSSPAGLSLTPTLVNGPAFGTVTISPGGSFLYVQAAGFIGTDSFTYLVDDGTLQSNVATVYLHVADAAPTMADTAYQVVHDAGLVVPQWQGVSANAGDADGDPLTVLLVAEPIYGVLSLNPSGSFTYVPDPDFIGTDAFSYQVSDGVLVSTIATAYIKVTDSAPTIAGTLSFQVTHDQSLVVPTWQGVLAGAGDADNDALTADLLSGPVNGTLTLYPSGSFVYQPNAGFTGTDTFLFCASDGLVTSSAYMVTLNATQAVPLATGDTYFYLPGQTLAVGASNGILNNDSDPDGNPLTPILVDSPTYGALYVSAGGAFTYTPSNGFVGTDHFSYEVTDGVSISSPTTVTLAAWPAPLLDNTTYTAVHDQALIISPGMLGALQNAVPVDGQPLAVSLWSAAEHGTVTLAGDGSFTYVPTSGFVGVDSFYYQAKDGLLASNVAEAFINVFDQVPTANSASFTVAADSSLTVANTAGVVAISSDADGDQMTPRLVDAPTHGTVVIFRSGAFTYVPDLGFAGEDSFSYVVTDGIGDSDAAVISISVDDSLSVPNIPAYSTWHDQSLVVTASQGLVMGAQTSSDNPLVIVDIDSSPVNGVVQFNGDGSFVYTPAAGFIGQDSFTYLISDGILNAVGTAMIQVNNSINVAPLDYTVLHDQTQAVDAAHGVLSADSDSAGYALSAILVNPIFRTPAHDGRLSEQVVAVIIRR